MKELSNKARFIKEQCDDVIDLRKKKRDVVIKLLKDNGYDVMDGDEEYKYLRDMKLSMVEEENYIRLMNDRENKKGELETLKNTSIEDMWYTELEELEKEYLIYQNARKIRAVGKASKKKKKSKKLK